MNTPNKIARLYRSNRIELEDVFEHFQKIGKRFVIAQEDGKFAVLNHDEVNLSTILNDGEKVHVASSYSIDKNRFRRSLKEATLLALENQKL